MGIWVKSDGWPEYIVRQKGLWVFGVSMRGNGQLDEWVG